MQTGLFAFGVASAFLGAAVYVNIVEQPARLALGPHAMIREWAPSNRRGSILLATLSVIASILALVHYGRTGDARWILGGLVILASWPYAIFIMVPVNIWLCTLPPNKARTAIRELMRDWGLLEWGQTAIGLGACCLFAWALVLPV
jgi:hypothetical protein